MKRYLKLWLRFTGQFVKSLMVYRGDFFFGLVGFVLFQAMGVAFIGLIFSSVKSFMGWGLWEILFIYGFAQIPRGIDHVFTDNLWILAGRIVSRGDFDRYLIRPVNPLFQVIAERLQTDGLGEIVVGAILLPVSSAKLGLAWTPAMAALFAVAVASGIAIYTSLKLLMASLAFWMKTSDSFLYASYQVADFAKYPVQIYSRWIRDLLTFLLPFAFTAYYPAAVLLGREPAWFGVGVGAGIAALLACIALFVWNRGLAAYESAGS